MPCNFIKKMSKTNLFEVLKILFGFMLIKLISDTYYFNKDKAVGIKFIPIISIFQNTWSMIILIRLYFIDKIINCIKLKSIHSRNHEV